MRKILILKKMAKTFEDKDYYEYDIKYSIPATSNWGEVSDDEFDLLIRYQQKLNIIVIEQCVESIEEILNNCLKAQDEEARLAQKRAEAEERRKKKQQEKKKLSKQKEKEEELLLLQELKKKYES